MELEATFITLILLLGLWFLYQRSAQDMPADDERKRRKGGNAQASGIDTESSRRSDRSTWLQRVPKIFTQPHLIPGTVGENTDYRYQAAYANNETTANSTAASLTQASDTDTNTDSNVMMRGSTATSGSNNSVIAGSDTTSGDGKPGTQQTRTAAGFSDNNGRQVNPNTSGTSDDIDSSNSGRPSVADTGGQYKSGTAQSNPGPSKSTGLGQSETAPADGNTGVDLTASSNEVSGNQSTEADYSVNSAANDNVSAHTSAEKNVAASDTSASADKRASLANNIASAESGGFAGSGEPISADESKISDSQLLQHHLEDSPTNTQSPNNDELRQTQSELLSVKQQRDRYVEQIKSLKEEIKYKQQDEGQLPSDPVESQPTGNAFTENDSLTYLDSSFDSADTSTSSSGVSDSSTSGHVRQMFVRPVEKDDLKLIKGIGKVMEKTLHDLGITTFKQLASFQQSDIQKVSDALTEFPGRIERDNWVGQAKEFYQASRGAVETEK